MARSPFLLRVSNRTFEYYSGIGYQDEGGSAPRCIPVEDFWSLHLSVAGAILDEDGVIIGHKFRDKEDGRIYDVYPGKVYSISVWTTAVDDDGCPEDICIDFYVELVPNK